MGSLSNLYISQSYQSLAHLGTNNALVAGQMTQLQDGLGNSLNINFDGTNISSSGNIYGANITASVINTGSFVTTSSFNSYTQSVSTTITNLSASLTVTDDFLQAQINAIDASGSAASVAALNAFTASQLNINSGYNAFTASANVSISNLNSATASLFTSTSLSLITASFDTDTRNLTFTKGNTTQFSVNIPDVSGSSPTTIFEVVFTGENITKGDPLYISGSQGANPTVFKADAADPNKMPVTFVSNETIGVSNTTNAIVLGLIEGINLTGYTAGQSIYVAEGGGWSASLPSGSNSVTQLLGVVTKGGSGGKGLVLNPGPAQLPGLDTGYMWVGNGNNQPTEITTASFASSASFNSYTASNDQKVDSLIARTGSYATTGSNSFIGNQIITGNVTISGSATSDLTVVGQIFVSSSATGGTTAPKITISGSSGQTVIFRNSISTTNGTDTSGIFPSTLFSSDVATLDEMGFTIDPSVFGISGWSTGPAFYVNNTSGDTYPAVFGFQNKANYTDGRVAVLTPLSASAGFTASLQNGYAWVGNSLGQNTQVATSSFGTSINTGSFATTGSNTFTGDQTLIDNAGNFFTISDASGSMMLVAKGFTSASAHMSASAAGIGNFIFKTNSNTADTIISGSNNIFTNATAPTAGFKRYVGGSNNLINTSNLPQLSGSMQFSPSMNANYQAGNITMRGPVSSSAWTINSNTILGTVNIGPNATNNAEKLTSGLSMTANNILGTLNITANQSALTGSTTTLTSNTIAGIVVLQLSSSAVTMANNIINDAGFTFTNEFFSSSAGLGSVAVNRNNIAGQANSLIVVGAQPAGTTTATSFSDNFIGGGSNIVYGDIANARVSGTTAYHNAIRNIIFGNQLIVTGSSLLSDTTSFGSAFFGRWNANDSIRNKTSDVVFAVGTGNSTTRKTGFLIDSGSNTFVEGTFNVSGSSSLSGTVNITGSLLVNGVAPATINTASFATTGSNSFNGNQTITGSLTISGSIITVDRSAYTDNVYLGVDALGMGGAGGQPLAVSNTNAIAIGPGAMRYASGSTQNVAIGGQSLSITTGSNNIAIGFLSMQNNTTGRGNVAIGIDALKANTTGEANFALGGGALVLNTTGGENVAIGGSALNGNISGQRNIAIGSSAGIRASGSNNILIGYFSGADISGSNNVVLGSYNAFTPGEVINNNIIIADGSGILKAQYDGDWQFKDNVNITGSLNVSGSTSMTGSLNVSGSTSMTGSLRVVGNQIITGSLVVSSSAGQINSFTSLDSTEQRIKNQLAFTGSRFVSGPLSMSVDMENLSYTTFGFNQLASSDNQTGAKFLLTTNKDSNFTKTELKAVYTGSSDAVVTLQNTNTGARTFTIDADTTMNGNLSVTGDVKLSKGSNKTCDIVSVNGSLTVSNSLVTTNSIILVTTQNGVVGSDEYPAVVTNKGAGTFDIQHNYAGSLDVAYLIINPV
jgi:hypothetical protein